MSDLLHNVLHDCIPIDLFLKWTPAGLGAVLLSLLVGALLRLAFYAILS
jgi:hypothetical protein